MRRFPLPLRGVVRPARPGPPARAGALACLALLLGVAPARAGLDARFASPPPGGLETELVARAGDVVAAVRGDGRGGEARIHALVRVPRGAARQARSEGVHLLRSVDGDVWLASLPAAEVARRDVPRGVEAAWAIRPTDRVAPGLAARLEAGSGGPDLALRVKRYADAPDGEILAAVRAAGGRVERVSARLGVLDVSGPASLLATLAALDAVRWIEPAPPRPATANNGMRVDAHVNEVQALGIDGAGIVLGMWDESAPDTLHPDLAGRVHPVDGSMYVATHSTHVAGIAVGDGTNSEAQGGGGLQWRGVATAATLYAWDVVDHLAEVDTAVTLFAIDVANNSWRYPPDAGSCELFGQYGSDAPEYDAIVRGAYGRALPVVFAAGNERDDGICGLDSTGGYGSTTPPGTAKNVITVGAHQSDVGHMTPFSAWGPTSDGRMKPDLTAPGCQVSGDLGITSTGVGVVSGIYSVRCGTSQAAPAVSGAVALLVQDWRARFPDDPRPATAKALLGGFAMDRANPGPDYRFGLGAIDVAASVEALRTMSTVEDAVDDAGLDEWTFVVPSGLDTLRLTLAWDDPPGAELADTTLVNDLDLELVGPTSGTHLPFVLDPANPSADATTGRNRLDNVEQVRVLAPEAGVWTARVLGTSVPDGPQDYSLVGFDARPPADVAGLAVVALDDTSAALTWIRPGDSDRAGTLVVRSTAPITWTPTDGATWSVGAEPQPGVFVVANDDVDRSTVPLVDDALAPGTLHHWALFAYDEVPTYAPGVADTVTTSAGAVPVPVLPPGPARIRFVRTGPNPVRDAATFRFELPDAAPVAVEVFDASGRRVAALLEGVRQAGSHRVVWDGRDASGSPVGSGIYFVRFRAPGTVRTEKIVRLR